MLLLELPRKSATTLAALCLIAVSLASIEHHQNMFLHKCNKEMQMLPSIMTIQRQQMRLSA